MSEFQRVQFAKSGVSIAIPTNMRIRHSPPQLFAESVGRYATVAMAVGHEDATWEYLKQEMQQGLGICPDLESRTVRQGAILSPYRGMEWAVEHSAKATGLVTSSWKCLLEASGHRIEIELSGDGSFAENEAEWRRIVGSIKVHDG